MPGTPSGDDMVPAAGLPASGGAPPDTGMSSAMRRTHNRPERDHMGQACAVQPPTGGGIAVAGGANPRNAVAPPASPPHGGRHTLTLPGQLRESLELPCARPGGRLYAGPSRGAQESPLDGSPSGLPRFLRAHHAARRNDRATGPGQDTGHAPLVIPRAIASGPRDLGSPDPFRMPDPT